MTEKITSYQLGENLACPYCDAVLMAATPVTGGPPKGFKKGHITICAHCAGVSQLGDSSFQQMTPDDIGKLPKETQNTLAMLRQTITKQIGERPKEDND